MNDSSQRAAFYKLFEESPGDLAAYGAMADLLDEDGWNKLAHAFRWMSKRGKFPHKRERYCGRSTGTPGRRVPKAHQWAWYRRPLYPGDKTVSGVLPKADRETHSLPMLLLFGDQKICGSHQEAVMFLAHQLDNLKNTYDVELKEGNVLPLSDSAPVSGRLIDILADET